MNCHAATTLAVHASHRPWLWHRENPQNGQTTPTAMNTDSARHCFPRQRSASESLCGRHVSFNLYLQHAVLVGSSLRLLERSSGSLTMAVSVTMQIVLRILDLIIRLGSSTPSENSSANHVLMRLWYDEECMSHLPQGYEVIQLPACLYPTTGSPTPLLQIENCDKRSRWDHLTVAPQLASIRPREGVYTDDCCSVLSSDKLGQRSLV